MQDSFVIKQSLTFPDFFRATLFYYFGSRRFKRFIIFYTVAVAAFIFLEIFSFGNDRFSGWEVLEYVVPVILLTLVGILAMFIYSLITYKLTRPRLTDITIEITHWGFTCRDWQPEVSKPWRQIATFKETASFFILYPDSLGFYVIRKAAIKSGEEVSDLRILLKEKFKS